MSYTTLKLPTDFVEKYVDPAINEEGSGFSSRSEFVKAAIRQYKPKVEDEN
ncbi:ribbon-helix-helix domain-containing protein [Candidatus Lokiarchaeum ossiferum]|uniref:ribbon-helix-helix domain-containing protein n=1 Tax=Candidatus Lokiarchaeum ossiferum TaxID=2951803 RepID=UPI00352E8F70